METQQNKYGTIADFNSRNYNKRYVFVLNHQNPTPTVEGRYFPNSVSFPMIDEIYDTELNKMRKIRYVPGELSIFADQQSPDDKVPKKTEYLTFSKWGDIIVDGREAQKLEFMLKSNWNGSNPIRDKNKKAKYYMLDLESGLKTERERDEKLTNAKQWCYNASWDKIKAYARVLGLDVNRDPDEIRWGLKLLAEKDAVKFMVGLDNPLTNRKHYVLEAIDREILTLNMASNSLSWKNGSNICIAPLGKNPVDHFVDLTQNEEGERTYKSIEQLLAPKIQKEKEESEVHDIVPKNVIVKEVADPVIESKGDDTESIFNKAKEKGIIVDKRIWIYLGDKIFRRKEFMEKLRTDKVFAENIKAACN